MVSIDTIVKVTDRTKNRFSLAYALGYTIKWTEGGNKIKIYSYDLRGNYTVETPTPILRKGLFEFLCNRHKIEVLPIKEPMDPNDGDRHTYYKNYRKMYANL